MSQQQQRNRIRTFVEQWTNRGYEKGESQKFWLELLGLLGVDNPYEFIEFEDQVQSPDHTAFIDAYIPATQVMIEQKSLGKDLRKGIRQSDGSVLTPFQQAQRYVVSMPRSKHPRWIVACNFAEFLIYDMERPNGEPTSVLLRNLERELYRLQFLVKTQDAALKQEMELSLKAGELVDRLYTALLQQYIDPTSPETLRSLNALCVRLVFCLYAEDAELFPSHNAFHDFVTSYDPDNLRAALISLFRTLNTPTDKRDPYERPELLAFPYVNGGLFADEHIEIPRLTPEIQRMIANECSADFDWSGISPTIFGAVFESTLNPETRRSGGMHYTSIENIHKVIDPLFLDSLTQELDQIAAIAVPRQRNQRLADYQEQLAKLTFLDPACGSGNFLTETFLSLRRLENRAIKLLRGDDRQRSLGGDFSPIKVSIAQFYGIEINDFAATVAKTALWIAESQMMKETEDIVGRDLDFLPLKTYANITEANALQTDWAEVAPKHNLSYIIGNPPFVGYSFQSKEQKNDILSIYKAPDGKPYKTAGKIDFVAGWYFKAAELMHSTPNPIRAAFVSTNSITQGEQTTSVWKPLYDRFGVHIDFAYRTFRWDSEATLKAHVHCVIIGFSVRPRSGKARIYNDNENYFEAENINPYLIETDNIFVESRKNPLCDVPTMSTGNRPADGGNLIIEAKDYDEFVKKEPKALNYIKGLLGSQEFINGEKRYCLWLVNASPAELKSMPMVMERIRRCREDRLNSPDAGRRKLADKPHLFRETNNPSSFIIIPSVSSERRRYIPLGFMDGSVIASNLVLIIPNATLYHFGVLTSNVHMAWMRVVCGRLKSDYRYSKDIVYNNFPWPSPTSEQRLAIEQTARAILDARSIYPDSSLAELYDEVLMPPELRRAHQDNDRAVMRAYGFTPGKTTESQCVAALFRLHQQLVAATAT